MELLNWSCLCHVSHQLGEGLCAVEGNETKTKESEKRDEKGLKEMRIEIYACIHTHIHMFTLFDYLEPVNLSPAHFLK